MAEAAAKLMLAVGDRVVYPNQGVCRVSGIEAQEVAGQKLTFVTMVREEDGARVMVPEAKVQAIGLRKVATAPEVNRVFEFLRSDSDKADLDWKLRARTNAERMATGGILGLTEVVKGLQVLSELRPLPAKERELYDSARHLLVAEISAALTITECDAEDAIDLVLFPPGRERPKRTAEEFRVVGAEDEGLDLGDDLLAMGTDLDLPSEEEHAEEPAEEATEEAAEEEAAPEGGGSEEARPARQGEGRGRRACRAKKRGRPPKAKAEAAAPAAAPKKRGRPPKAKAEAAEPAAPKKRGRPPKAKTVSEAPKKPAAKAKKK